MNTLADAWKWYEATKLNLTRMQRLGSKHWSDPSLVGASIWQDDEFKMLEVADIVEQTTTSLKPVDDLAIVVLFSVFEAQVRDFLVEQIRPEADELTDSILKDAADDVIRGVLEGSFYRRVLEPLKKQSRVSADLVTQVDQVRDYRNWVAHGRRRNPGNNVTPKGAYDRLKEFLEKLGIAIESEKPEQEASG